VSVLSQYIERPVSEGGAGIATVALNLIRPVAEAIKPPRALWVPFPFGRPLGPPNRPDIQIDVLRQTLALVDQPAAPALVDYPDTFEEAIPSEGGWSCPVSFPNPEPKTELDALRAQLNSEAELLRPWFDEGIRARGRTTIGISGKGVDSIGEMLGIMASFSLDCEMGVPDGFKQPMPQLLRYLAADIRAFYSEAAISKPGDQFPSPDDLEEWFFLETVAGDVFYQVRERLLGTDMLILLANGLDDNAIDTRLILMPGSTTSAAEELVRNPGITRELLQKSADGSTGYPVGRFSRTIVPTTMQDRRNERAEFVRAS